MKNIKFLLLLLTAIVFLVPGLTAQVTDKAKLAEFEDAITKGEEYLQAKDYAKAKAEYQRALTIDPQAKFPKDKLAQIRKVYTDPKDETDFLNAVTRGDQFMTSANYESAKEQYTIALGIKPDDKTVKEKLSAADKALTERIGQLKEYESLISEADKLYNEKNYVAALEKYKQAQPIKPVDNHPAARISEIENFIAKEKAIDDNYNASVNAADEAYMNRDFQTAKKKYEEAARIKPSESYPNSMLEKVKSAIIKQAEEGELNAQLEKERQAALAAERLKEQQRQDSLRAIEEAERLALQQQEREQQEKLAQLLAEKQQREQDSIALTEKQNRVLDSIAFAENQQKINDSIATAEKIKQEQDRLSLLEAERLEQEKKENELLALKQAENQRIQDSVSLAAEAERKELQRLAEIKQQEEDKARAEALALASEADREYYEAIEAGNSYFTLQDLPSALRMFEKAAGLKPMEEYPKDRIIKISNILQERLKNNIESYHKFIAAGDLAFQSNQFDKALEEFEKAVLTRPEEQYPARMIERIRKLMEDNALITLSTDATVLSDANTRKYTFNPVEMRLRKNNYLLIKARKASEKAPKVFVNYGKDDSKSGGFVLKGIESDETVDYLLRISIQDKWYRVDNNWITLYPEGGDIEITAIQISQGDIQTVR